jgi:DNA-binding XRE family transcriptional regulator
MPQSVIQIDGEKGMTMKRPLRETKSFEREISNFQKKFGIVVRQLRKERQLSRPELARLAKLSQTTLEHIEQGKANPTLGRVESLAAALGYRLSYIFKLTQNLDK